MNKQITPNVNLNLWLYYRSVIDDYMSIVGNEKLLCNIYTTFAHDLCRSKWTKNALCRDYLENKLQEWNKIDDDGTGLTIFLQVHAFQPVTSIILRWCNGKRRKKGREHFTAQKLKCYSQMTVVGWKALKGEKRLRVQK